MFARQAQNELSIVERATNFVFKTSTYKLKPLAKAKDVHALAVTCAAPEMPNICSGIPRVLGPDKT
jgi:hypothetical protein